MARTNHVEITRRQQQALVITAGSSAARDKAVPVPKTSPPKNQALVITVLIWVIAILLSWMVVVHAQLKEAKELHDGLFTRIDELQDLISQNRIDAKSKINELQKLNSQLQIDAKFNTDHIKTLERIIDDWCLSNSHSQSIEKHYRHALESARSNLSRCKQT